ncbi:hypothetical protein NM688_g5557 [Phlebia brevispora]|uniref:Uncharacterized protein n=1 Tax=Phlebia brevispora TaxID=194682 RepID=A0ACC1STH7_9APHY|nr:hypothetical protein NM688_g5557 [Phlebia brevispora]
MEFFANANMPKLEKFVMNNMYTTHLPEPLVVTENFFPSVHSYRGPAMFLYYFPYVKTARVYCHCDSDLRFPADLPSSIVRLCAEFDEDMSSSSMEATFYDTLECLSRAKASVECFAWMHAGLQIMLDTPLLMRLLTALEQSTLTPVALLLQMQWAGDLDPFNALDIMLPTADRWIEFRLMVGGFLYGVDAEDEWSDMQHENADYIDAFFSDVQINIPDIQVV